MTWQEESIQVVEQIFTEDRTDRLIEALFEKMKLPWWFPKRMAKKFLDQLLPEVITDSIRDVLLKEVTSG